MSINQQAAVDAAWDTLQELNVVDMRRDGPAEDTPEWWVGRLEGALVPLLDSIRVPVPA